MSTNKSNTEMSNYCPNLTNSNSHPSNVNIHKAREIY